MKIAVERIECATEEARALIAELDAELAGDYAPEQRHGFAIDRVFQPDVRFFIVRLNGVAAGCGAIAFEDGFAELKRMYVRPDQRGLGAVQALVERLEVEALEAGFRLLALETGDSLFAAMRVYERAGFRRCAAFGDYLRKPAHTIARSVFFEKVIA